MKTVYCITNRNTQDAYVGSTGALPFARWGAHVLKLRLGQHHNAALQKLWTRQPRLQYWSFEILQSDVPDDQILGREQFWFERLRPTLNGTDRISRMVSHARTLSTVRTMLADGEKFRDIAKAAGCSLATVSVWNKKMLLGEL